MLDELEAVYLRLTEIEVEGVAVIKLRVNIKHDVTKIESCMKNLEF